MNFQKKETILGTGDEGEVCHVDYFRVQYSSINTCLDDTYMYSIDYRPIPGADLRMSQNINTLMGLGYGT